MYAAALLGLAACDRPAPPRTDPFGVAAPPTAIEPVATDEPLPLLSAPLDEAPPHLVLVTLDGVRWEDVFAGTARAPDPPKKPPRAQEQIAFPNLHRLVSERGAAFGGAGCPHDVRVSGPSNFSLPGYMEIFGGRQSPTCIWNDCPKTTTPTLVDDVRAKTSAHEVAVFASWSTYARAVAKDTRSITLSAGAEPGAAKSATDPELAKLLAAGAEAGPFPGLWDYRPDVHTARIALHYLEVSRPRLLVVGLGDADEQAHRGDIDAYYRALRAEDAFLQELDATLARMGSTGRRTTVIVTTDHGRAHTIREHGPAFAEAARVWVAAWNGAIVRRGVACAASPLRLAHVASAARTILELERDADGGPLTTELLGGPSF